MKTYLVGLIVSCAALAGVPAKALELSPDVFAGRSAARSLEAMPPAADGADAVFARAVGETLVAVEEMGREFYALGLSIKSRDLPVPFLRLPLPDNPEPRAATAADVRRILDVFHGRMAAIDARLASIEGREFKAVIPLGEAGFDFVGKDAPGDRVEFGPFFRAIAGRGRAVAAADPANAPAEAPFTVAFDQTDALWLRAYTHLLRGLADVMLAHDGGELFEATAQLYFAKADTALARALAARKANPKGGEGDNIADLIATLHGLNLRVAEPERAARARVELLEMIRLSRATLASAAAETDNDREWLPSPAQASAFGLALTAEQGKAWEGVLAEIEALLNGEKLLPHWRFPGEGRGINLKRLIEESRRTDLVGYVQGAAAVPFLETGPTTSRAAWRELMRVFGGNFLGYALWIN